MGLKNCKECKKEISTSAKICPHCGKKRPTGGLPLWVKILFIFIGLIVLGQISRRFDKSDSNQTTETTTAPKENKTGKSSTLYKIINDKKQDSQSQEKIYKEGEVVNVGYTSYRVEGCTFWNSLPPYFTEKPDARFLLVALIVRNDDAKARTIPLFKLIDENGAEYETNNKGLGNDYISVLDSLNPGVQKKGVIVFDVPMEHQYKLKVSGGFWTSKTALIELAPKANKLNM